MAYQRITGSDRREIQSIVRRCWAAGLTEATFSQVAKDAAAWGRRAHQAEEAASKPKTATEIIATLRAAGRSVREIAAAVGVHTSTVYRWARGLFRPTAARLAILATI